MEIRKLFETAAVAVALAGCGNHLTKEQVIDYGEIGYADIVSFIVVGYQTNWDGMSPGEMNLSPVYAYSSPYAGFTKKDIDRDGYDELLIGDQFEDGSYSLYDIYCFNKKDASLIHLACGGERDRFVINGEGIILETGSNSAADSFTKGYMIKNGKLVEVDGWEESLMDVRLERFSDLSGQQQLCGGYTGQRELTEEEMEMFRQVTETGGVVFTPLSVSTQVVAGTNYRFYCRFEDKDGSDKYGYCWVTIFKPLPGQGEARLSSIDKE
ncbi:MAG: hypothetical protein MJY89_08155 [Bacteroidales bacterium]|nr:hypothetical protein [Bacteroidales bacterium]